MNKVPTFMKEDKGLLELKALLLWGSFDDNEKAGCRFGMFPFVKMQAAEQEGYNGKDLCVALMKVAGAK